MIFAFSPEEQRLVVAPDAAGIEILCPLVDIVAQRWLFFSEDGAPLQPDASRVERLVLRPWASCSSCSLPQVLPYVRLFDGFAHFSTVDALCRHLGIEPPPSQLQV